MERGEMGRGEEGGTVRRGGARRGRNEVVIETYSPPLVTIQVTVRSSITRVTNASSPPTING